MAEATDKFVIRRHTPVRTLLLRTAGILIGLFALYVVFEFGRYSAGFDRAKAATERGDLQQVIAGLKNQIQDLHAQMAQLQMLQAGAAREHQEVGREMAELQAQIDRDRQDLAVYRGVIAPASSGSSLQVQQLRISSGDAPRRYVAHLTLMQGGKPDVTVNGSVSVRVTGQLNGATATVDGTGSTANGAVSFRYYQGVDYRIELPPGFAPAAVEITLRDGRSNGTVGTQSFPWRVDVQP
ncbi:MAG TPA: DUF6776 family protein [Steroidobacteraceae bacterium]|jgi:hypothetical protein|nr:DUF6776 family protein [Steroidobacteraceae bacterium]